MTSTSSRPDADIHALLAAFSACGATAGGGITRLAASPEDGRARDLMRDCLGRLGAEIRIDRVGNLFGLVPLARNPHAPLVMLGSHLDSQTRAGLQARARRDASGRDETIYLQPLEAIVAAGRSRAEELLAAYEGEWAKCVDPAFSECTF